MKPNPLLQSRSRTTFQASKGTPKERVNKSRPAKLKLTTHKCNTYIQTKYTNWARSSPPSYALGPLPDSLVDPFESPPDATDASCRSATYRGIPHLPNSPLTNSPLTNSPLT